MKLPLAILFFITIVLSACTKDGTVGLQAGSGCIDRVTVPVSAHSINAGDIPIVNKLFKSSNIDVSKYRYYQYNHDYVQTFFPPYAQFDNKIVRVDEYTNGLRIFTGQLVFSFKNDQFDFKGGDDTKGTNLDTRPVRTLTQLRKLFIDNAEQFEHKGAQYKDSCIKAEFGYFNTNAGIGYTSENLIQAWRITLKNSVFPSEYPVAYYHDKDGALIYYDNGIRTFK